MVVYLALVAETTLWLILFALSFSGSAAGLAAAVVLVAVVNTLGLSSELQWRGSRGRVRIRWPGWRRFLLWFTPLRLYFFPAWVSQPGSGGIFEEPFSEWERRVVLGVGAGAVAIAAVTAVAVYNLSSPVHTVTASVQAERLTVLCSVAVRGPHQKRGPFAAPEGPAPGCACAADAFLRRMRTERPGKVELALILIEDNIRYRHPIPDARIAEVWAVSMQSCRTR